MSLAESNQSNDSNTVNDIANSVVNCNVKQMKFKSPVWRHFTYEDVNGTGMAVYDNPDILFTETQNSNQKKNMKVCFSWFINRQSRKKTIER
ncbi:unnamed protein product [Lactuca virosa]|uniref:Uncharacterized protein n=1 Tax=Lactuca virosa TaxID=75947 RepID=A0AAU9MIY8_9ASTR|nr:unnamed protein product [Lactuca virosa]